MKAILFVWDWMNKNDLPNWIVLIFTGTVWPLVLFAWSRRKVGNVPNLEVSVLKNKGLRIGDTDYDSVEIRFAKNTGSVVYLTNYRVLKCSKHFPIHPDSERDIKDGTIPIKFFDPATKQFDLRQITLQTSEKASTAIPLTTRPSDELIGYEPPWLRKIFRLRKYFWLEYTAMVGNKRYRVRTKY